MGDKIQIQWNTLTVDEINAKLLQIQMFHSSTVKMVDDLIQEVEKWEKEHEKGVRELNNRKIE